MHIFDAIRTRRSVKHFDATYRLSDDEEALLLDLAKEAPSSFNAQHWRLVNVKDPVIRTALRAIAFDQAQVTEASHLFVVCADMKAWEKQPSRYYRNAPEEIQDILVPWMGDFYAGKELLQRDEAIRSASFIAHTMMLAARAMGLDSCPLIGFDAGKAADIIRLPRDHVIAMMLVIGKGLREPWPKPGYIERHEFILEDRF